MPWHKVNRPSRRRWSKVRLQVLDRDGWKCSCGKSARLEVHHRVPLEHGGDFYELSNLESLCKSCHILRHGGTVRKKTSEVQDWQRYLQAR